MPLQKRNPELVSLLSADLQPRYEPNFAWGQAPGILLLPRLRGFWPLSSLDENLDVYDLSGQGRTLTNNNAATFGWLYSIIPQAVFNGTTQYLSRTDEAGLDITGDLTCGCWVRFDGAASADEVAMAKYGAAGSRSFVLYRDSLGPAEFQVSHDCTTPVIATSTGTTLSALTWYFLWGRFNSNGANSSVEVGVNRDYWTQATATSTLCNSGADFTIGATAVPSAYMDGRVALPFLCAEYLYDQFLWNIFEQTRALFGV